MEAHKAQRASEDPCTSVSADQRLTITEEPGKLVCVPSSEPYNIRLGNTGDRSIQSHSHR
jgi:hypothetical protein